MQRQHPEALEEVDQEVMESFEHDENEAIRRVLDRITQRDRPLAYLRALNLLISNRGTSSRQRRDIAGIARTVAESAIFPVLHSLVHESSVNSHSPPLQIAKLISHLCSENPHLIDSIKLGSPELVAALFNQFSTNTTDLTQMEHLTTVVHFLHHVSLKETSVRTKLMPECLQKFVHLVLTHDPLAQLTHHKRFAQFSSALIKFHDNVPEISKPLFTSLLSSLRKINDEFKQHAQNAGRLNEGENPQEGLPKLKESIELTDKKLVGALNMFRRTREQIFGKYDAFSFLSILRVLVKFTVTRPICLIGRQHDNRQLVETVADLIGQTQSFRNFIRLNQLIEDVKNRNKDFQKKPDSEGRMEEEKGSVDKKSENNDKKSNTDGKMQLEKGNGGKEDVDKEEQQHQPPEEQSGVMDGMRISEPQRNRLQIECRRFDEVIKTICFFSQKLVGLVKSTAALTLSAASEEGDGWVSFRQQVLTVRLERVLGLIYRVFPQEEYNKGNYYAQILEQLSPLLPIYFNRALNSEVAYIKRQINNLTDLVIEAESSDIRYLKDKLDEQTMKNVIHGRLSQHMNSSLALFDTLSRFFHAGNNYKQSMEAAIPMVHSFISFFRKTYLQGMQPGYLGLEQVESCRLVLKILIELFPPYYDLDLSQPDVILKSKLKVYRYSSMVKQNPQDGILALIGDIVPLLNAQTHHSVRELIDTPQNRQTLLKSVFSKLSLQRIKTFLGHLTVAHTEAVEKQLPYQDEDRDIDISKEVIERGTVNYYYAMTDFIKRAALCSWPASLPEQLCALVLSRILHYSCTVNDPQAPRQSSGDFRKAVDSVGDDLLAWLYKNIHKPIIKMPILIDRILHFSKPATSQAADNILQLHQEQVRHTRAFLQEISFLLADCHLAFTDRKMDIGFKIKKKRPERTMTIPEGVQLVANCTSILGQFIKLLLQVDYLEPNSPRLEVKHFTSIIQFAVTILEDLAVDKHFPKEANSLIKNTLWFISEYLHYRMHLDENNQEKKRVKRHKKKQQNKQKGQFVQKAKNKRKKQKKKDLKASKKTQEPKKQLTEKKQQSKSQQFEAFNKKRKNRKRNKPVVDEQQKNSVKETEKNHSNKMPSQKQGKGRKKQGLLQNLIQGFLRTVLHSNNAGESPYLTNQVLQYYIFFLSRNMRAGLLAEPPSPHFQVKITDLLPAMLEVKVSDGRVPGYFMLLCKLGLQLLDENHLKVDYELTLKRYFYERQSRTLTLTQFMTLIRDRYEEAPQLVAALLQIYEPKEDKAQPFDMKKAQEIADDKQYLVRMKKGVQLHVLNAVQPRRKLSGPDQERRVKVGDYLPEGDLYSCLFEIIRRSIDLLIQEIDRSCQFNPEESYQHGEYLEPFNLKGLIHTLHYVIRESPSLGPCISRFKCKRIILQCLKSEHIKHKESVTQLVNDLLMCPKGLENSGQINFLSVIIRLFSPFTSNSISPLLFELCLDSTPLIENRDSHAPFASVIRLKTVQEIDHILFNTKVQGSFFRRLSLLSVTTVLMNIKEVSKLLIQHNFVAKLYQSCREVKSWLESKSVPSMSLTRLVFPFYLTPASLLQQINIALHQAKKQQSPKIQIHGLLEVYSINSQLMPLDSLKKYKFRKQWPLGNYHHQPQIDDDAVSRQFEYESVDSDEDDSDMMNSDMDSESGFRELEQPDDFSEGSYVSFGEEQNSDLLNEEWDYSLGPSARGSRSMLDQVDEVASLLDDQEGFFNDEDIEEDQEDISGMSELDSEQIGSVSQGVEEDLNRSVSEGFAQDSFASFEEDSISAQSDFVSLVKRKRQSWIGSEALFEAIANIVSFEKVDCLRRLSRTEGEQVQMIRKYLQLWAYPQLTVYKKLVKHTRSEQQTKQEDNSKEKSPLRAVFEEDSCMPFAQFVEYNQIYRYDHFIKEFPEREEIMDKMFSDRYECPNQGRHKRRRNAVIYRNNDVIQIRPGVEITEVRTEVIDSPDREDFARMRRMDRNPIMEELNEDDEQMDDLDGDEDFERMEQEESLMEQMGQGNQNDIQIEELLRRSNLGITLRQFERLDPEIQNDILNNCLLQQQLGAQGNNLAPENSPALQQVPHPEPMEELPGQQLIRAQLEHNQQHGQGGQRAQNRMREGDEVQDLRAGRVREGMVEEEGVGFDETYRKMSMQHTKKIAKDTLEAINKLGKNNSKFYEWDETDTEMLLGMVSELNEQDYPRLPYPLFESACINTNNICVLLSALTAYLHQQEPPSTLNRLKVLHLMVHLSKVYSIAMSFLKVNNKPPSSLAKTLVSQKMTSLELVILLLKSSEVASHAQTLNLLITQLDNVTLHFFYKSINSLVVHKGEDENEQLKSSLEPECIELLVSLLQNNHIGNNLPNVSKIIMRMCLDSHNLRLFIDHINILVRTLAAQGLKELRNVMATEQQHQMQDQGAFKIVNIMHIFYEMVRAFETYPTSSEQHQQVLKSLRQIVDYKNLEILCRQAVEHALNSKNPLKVPRMLDCFFILYDIATITSGSPVEPQDENKHIAQLGQLLKSQHQEKNVTLGSFNLSEVLKESLVHPTFRSFVNRSIDGRLKSAQSGAFEDPMVRVALTWPHLLTFNNKRAIFRAELRRLRGNQHYDPIELDVSRDQVFEESFGSMMHMKPEQLRGKIKVEFKGEDGEDAGGLTREWFQLLSKQMFHPNYGLFKAGSAGNTYYPSSDSYINNQHLAYFKFIGRITGKALYDGHLLDVYFTPAFYKHILHLPISYKDIEEEDYPFYNSLKWILDNSPVQDFLELDFTYSAEHFGQKITKELVPGGDKKSVTEQNKHQYVQLLAYARMATSIKEQLQAFLQGLHDLVPHRLLRIFNEKQLEVMISGQPTVDIMDLRSNTEFVNYVKTDQVILWLWEVLEEFDTQLRTAFLQFVTGSSRVPVEGFSQLRGMNGPQRFNIHREFQEDRLPRAHTCFNQLDLPNYKSKDILIEKLTLAVTEGKEGFGML